MSGNEVSDAAIEAQINRRQEEMQSVVEFSGEGRLIESSFKTGPILPDGEFFHKVYISTLRRFPKHVCNCLIRNPISLISEDFYSYWSYTGACIYSFNQEDLTGDPERDSIRYFKSELCKLIHIMNFPIQCERLSKENQNAIKNHLPAVSAFDSKFSQEITGSVGYAVLHGLIKRRCDCLTLDGNLRRPIDTEIGEISPGRINLKQALYVWEEVATEPVADTLTYIRRIPSERSTDILGGFFEQTDATDLFDAIYRQRSFNLHGQGRTRILGILALTLCCLVYWDWVNSEQYHSAREDLISTLHWEAKTMQISGSLSTWSPLLFYPHHERERSDIFESEN